MINPYAICYLHSASDIDAILAHYAKKDELSDEWVIKMKSFFHSIKKFRTEELRAAYIDGFKGMLLTFDEVPATINTREHCDVNFNLIKK
jgi:hypothetical protein